MTDNVYQGQDFDDRVRKQVEFYFSDSNLQTDKFLWRIYEANDGWVELKTILTFGRMRQYRPEEKVKEALKGSKKLVLSNNEDMIRRKDPLRDFNELKNTRKRNSVHIEGFPSDTSQEQIEEFFNDKVAPSLPKEKEICSVRRVRSKSKKDFLGVVDVEFRTQDDAEFFLKELEVVYPKGIVDKDDSSVNKKEVLSKMSLLTSQEMKEGGKRFGVNEITKRSSSFNESRNNKRQKVNGKNSKKVKGSDSGEETLQAVEDEAVEDEAVESSSASPSASHSKEEAAAPENSKDTPSTKDTTESTKAAEEN